MKNLVLLNNIFAGSSLYLYNDKLFYDPNLKIDTGKYNRIRMASVASFMELCKYDTELDIDINDYVYVEDHNNIHECVEFEDNGDIKCENGLSYVKEKCHKIIAMSDAGSENILTQEEIVKFVQNYNKPKVLSGNEKQLLKVELADMYDFVEYLFENHITNITQEEAYIKYNQEEN